MFDNREKLKEKIEGNCEGDKNRTGLGKSRKISHNSLLRPHRPNLNPNNRDEQMKNFTTPTNRRQFLTYMATGTAGTLAMGLLFPRRGESTEGGLETLCSSFPYNSQCKNYLPGVRAVDSKGNPIEPSSLLADAVPGNPVPVEGLSKTTYLVINEGPTIAQYGIRPVCTHLGCTVEWKTELKRFVCPCHGSEYDSLGRVEKGPAERSLHLVMVVVKQNQIRLIDREPGSDPRSTHIN
jgi:cytochrome b6-f complex iron-sulfur subunit